MNELGPSSVTKALLDAAKGDGPSAAARAKIWTGVSATTGAATGAAGGATGAHAAALGGGKLIAVGALFGSAITIGVAATLLGIGSPPQLRPDPPWSEGARADPIAEPLGTSRPPARAMNDDRRGGAASTNGAASGRADAHAGHATAAHARDAREDALMRESAIVAEARGALVRGDAAGALSALAATHAMRPRELEPEELSLEARALRALGRDGEALIVEKMLRQRYPDHALAR